MLSKKEQSLLDVIEAHAAANGIEIVTVEIVGAKKAPVIRVYIDTQNGVSFNELSAAQAWIGDLLDAIDPFPGAYTLEVSSPGIDRPLRTLEHFARFIGEEAKVRLSESIDGKGAFTGTIVSCNDGEIVFSVDGQEMNVLLEKIKKANLIGKIEF